MTTILQVDKSAVKPKMIGRVVPKVGGTSVQGHTESREIDSRQGRGSRSYNAVTMSSDHTHSSPQTSELCYEDKASHLLSMSRQTADSIVDMMSVLYRQLHPNTDYTEATDTNSIANQSIYGQKSRKSILKTLPGCAGSPPLPKHKVTINSDRNAMSTYARGEDNGDQGLLTDYGFSTEFKSVYSEIKH